MCGEFCTLPALFLKIIFNSGSSSLLWVDGPTIERRRRARERQLQDEAYLSRHDYLELALRPEGRSRDFSAVLEFQGLHACAQLPHSLRTRQEFPARRTRQSCPRS